MFFGRIDNKENNKLAINVQRKILLTKIEWDFHKSKNIKISLYYDSMQIF